MHARNTPQPPQQPVFLLLLLLLLLFCYAYSALGVDQSKPVYTLVRAFGLLAWSLFLGCLTTLNVSSSVILILCTVPSLVLFVPEKRIHSW